MAQKGLCATRLSPFYGNLPDLVQEIARSDDALKNVDRLSNTDAAFLQKQAKAFNHVMGAVDADGNYNMTLAMENMAALINQKVLKKDGKLQAMSPREVGFYTKLGKNVMLASADGVKELSATFLAKANEGQLAVSEGLQFMKTLNGLATVTEAVNVGSFELGSGLRRLGVDFMDPDDLRASYRGRMGDLQAEAGDIANSKAKLDSIADMFNEGRTNEALAELRKLASQMSAANDPFEVIRMSRGMKSLPARIWDEVMINGLLWSPASMVTNAMGITWAFARPTFQLLAAQTAATFTNSSMAKQVAAEATAKLSAMYSGLSDGWKLAWTAYQKEMPVYGNTTVSGSMNRYAGPAMTTENFNQQIDEMFGTSPFEDDSIAQNIDRVLKAYRFPGRVMMGSDELVKHVAMRGEAAAMGVRRAYRDGLGDFWDDKAKFQQAIENEIGLAFDGPQMKLNLGYEYAARLKNQADIATFQESNSVAQGVQRVLDVPGLGLVLRPFFPFVRTPLNILKQGVIESTPLGLAGPAFNAGQSALMKAMRKTVSGTDTGPLWSKPTEAVIMQNLSSIGDVADGYRVVGQIGFTTAMIGFFYAGAMSGWITGGGPGRWESRQNARRAQEIWEKQGNIKYSIRIPGTDLVMPFDRLGEPLSNVLRIVTDMAMYSGYATQEEQDATMFGLANVAVTGLYQQSFLTGLRTLMDAFTNDTPDGVLKGRLVQNWMATQMPAGAAFNYIANVTDPYRAVYEGSKPEDMWVSIEDGFGAMFKKIGNRMPGRGGNPLMVDQVTGEPIPAIPGLGPTGLNALQLAIPFLPRQLPKADETWRMIGEMTPTLPDKKAAIPLTQAEQQQMNKLMSEVRINGKTYQQAVRDLYRTPEVQRTVRNLNGARADSELKMSNDLRSLGREYRDIAFELLKQQNNSVFLRYAAKQMIDVEGKKNNLSEVNRLQKQLDKLFEEARLRGVF